MKKIVLFDTSVGSSNKGDEIIMQSIRESLSCLFDKHYTMSFPTHTPCFHLHQQMMSNPLYAFVQNADYKFYGGTNVINTNLLRMRPNWNVSFSTYKCYKDTILIGAGTNYATIQSNFCAKAYTDFIQKQIFSHSYIHSVRDEISKMELERLGYQAIVTGCPTLWGLDEAHCGTIPRKKARAVVFTLTFYRSDVHYDSLLIKKLRECYEQVLFWPQAYYDISYFKTLTDAKNISIIDPSLRALSSALGSGVDYIGTRLHAGIYAMQHKVRTLIISVDNRAADMANTYDINALQRTDITRLDDIIEGEISTNINIDRTNILKWLSQFQ